MINRFFQVAAVAGLLAILLPQPAAAQNSSGWYAEARLGSTLVSDADFEELGTTGELTFEPGGSVDLAVGASFPGGLRLEYQLGARAAKIDEVEIDGVGTFDGAADLRTYSSMFNLYYDFDFGRMSGRTEEPSWLVPYIGGGIGTALHVLDFDGGGWELDKRLAYQGIGGLTFNFSRAWASTLSYAYLASSDPKFNSFKTEYASHNVMVGLRYSF